ncbi:MAG: DUF2513 domain-containing protein [Proteobacteria bacterium]|nr:DUF2513 domain-containing protein [Pseudomonadota bacterium]
MKRDPDVIRSIAMATEALKPGELLTQLPNIDQHTFAFHVKLMQDAGLVDAVVKSYLGNEPPPAVVMRLTWDGADFLDAARSDTLWAKAKKSVIAPTASWTFDILTAWLKEQIAQGLAP